MPDCNVIHHIGGLEMLFEQRHFVYNTNSYNRLLIEVTNDGVKHTKTLVTNMWEFPELRMNDLFPEVNGELPVYSNP